MPIEKDRYGRTVAEVFVKKPNSQEETFVNGELVMAGIGLPLQTDILAVVRIGTRLKEGKRSPRIRRLGCGVRLIW